MKFERRAHHWPRVRGWGLVLAMLSAACGRSDRASDQSSKAQVAPMASPSPAGGSASPASPAKSGEDPTQSPVGEDWLVWLPSDGGFETRWLVVYPDRVEVLARKPILVLSDGKSLWRVQRNDREVDVMPCDCFELTDSPQAEKACQARGILTSLGLDAVDLSNGQITRIVQGEPGPVVGEDIYRSLQVLGSAGDRLMLGWTDSGYYCGAHPLAEGGFELFDLSEDASATSVLPALGHALPWSLVEPAAESIRTQIAACEGAAPDPQELREQLMALAQVQLGLDDGEPVVKWTFEAALPYACSADYTASAQVQTGPIAAAAELGIMPLPAALARSLADAGQVGRAGWSRLDLNPVQRAAALKSFEGSDKPAWPPSNTQIRLRSEADPRQAPPSEADAQVTVSAARKLTREGELRSAIAAFDQAIALDPSLGAAWSGRGYARMLAGDLEQAKADFDQALQLDDRPEFRAAVYFNLGQIAARRDDVKTAEAAFEHSLKLRPNAAVQRALDRLRRRSK